MDVFGKDLPTPAGETASGEKVESEKKENGNVSKESNAQVAVKGPTAPIGPAVPTDQDYDPEELKKAEEFKTKGNEFFKGKIVVHIFL